eukprot:358032-Chlamydomonas_euryale.AAC.5
MHPYLERLVCRFVPRRLLCGLVTHLPQQPRLALMTLGRFSAHAFHVGMRAVGLDGPAPAAPADVDECGCVWMKALRDQIGQLLQLPAQH